jgi:hypothetical protein
VAGYEPPAETYAPVETYSSLVSERVTEPLPRHEILFDQTAPDLVEEAPLVPQEPAAERVFDQTAELEPPVEAAAPARPEPFDPVGDDLFIDLPAASAGTEDDPRLEIGGAPWDPVPVPPPTYATKPTAPQRRPRPPVFEPLLPPVESAEELDPVDDLEEILDRRWAVND